MGWRRRRSPRGWERDLLREIRALEVTDHEPDGGVVTPLTGRPARPPRRRTRPAGGARATTERRRTLLTVALTVVIIVGLASISLGPVAPVVRRLVGMGPVAGGDGHSYAFIRFDRAGRPAGFSPCQDIHYVVNPAQAPDDWAALVHESVGDVSRATGLRFVDDGTTTDDDFFDRRSLTGRAEPVLIGWSTADRVGELEGDVAGVTSSDYSPQTGHYDTGRVVLDADAFADMADEPFSGDEQRAVVEHELGHLVGLAHVDDPGELMYPTVTHVTTYAAGDLEGLRRIGQVRC